MKNIKKLQNKIKQKTLKIMIHKLLNNKINNYINYQNNFIKYQNYFNILFIISLLFMYIYNIFYLNKNN